MMYSFIKLFFFFNHSISKCIEGEDFIPKTGQQELGPITAEPPEMVGSRAAAWVPVQVTPQQTPLFNPANCGDYERNPGVCTCCCQSQSQLLVQDQAFGDSGSVGSPSSA